MAEWLAGNRPGIVDAEPVPDQGAFGANYEITPDLNAGVQIEANTSAFRDVEFFAKDPVTWFAGLRHRWDRFVLEGGFGMGFNRDSSYQYIWHVSFGWVF